MRARNVVPSRAAWRRADPKTASAISTVVFMWVNHTGHTRVGKARARVTPPGVFAQVAVQPDESSNTATAGNQSFAVAANEWANEDSRRTHTHHGHLGARANLVVRGRAQRTCLRRHSKCRPEQLGRPNLIGTLRLDSRGASGLG